MSNVIQKTRILKLTEIKLDPHLQVRSSLDERHIEDLVEVIRKEERFQGQMPVVFADGRVNWLADGFHRWHAHDRAGEERMECDLRSGGFEDAIEYAMREANGRHGLKLDPGAIKRKVSWHLAHQQYRHYTDGQIARWCHCSDRIVSRYREERNPEPVRGCDAPEWLEGRLKPQWRSIIGKGGFPRLYLKGKTLCIFDVGPSLKPATNSNEVEFNLDSAAREQIGADTTSQDESWDHADGGEEFFEPSFPGPDSEPGSSDTGNRPEDSEEYEEAGSDLERAMSWIAQSWSGSQQVEQPERLAELFNLTVQEIEVVFREVVESFTDQRVAQGFASALIRMYRSRVPDISEVRLAELVGERILEAIQARDRTDGNELEPTLTEEEELFAEDESDGKNLKDYKGRIVPIELREVFRDAREISRFTASLGRLRSWMQGVCERPAGVLVNYRKIEELVTNLKGEIMSIRPHIVCYLCDGSKRAEGTICRMCKGKGWLSYAIASQQPPQARKIIDEASRNDSDRSAA